MIAALILAAQAPLLRRDLAFAVWGEELPTTWASALRTAVSTVRRGLWACQPLAGSRLVTLPDAYQLLLPEQVDVDVIELLALVGSAQAALTADPTTALTLAAHCGRAATAVFLPGVTGAWVESWRNRLRGEIAAALRVEAEAALQTRRFLRARWAAERATTLEPFDESGQLLLLRSLVAARDAASALRAYHAYRRALVEDLGVEPGVDLQQAYLALLREARSDPPAAPGPIRISGPPGVHRPPSGLAKWAPDDAAALAEQAAARGDHIAAAQHFRVALDQLDSEDPATAEPRLGLLLGLADALNRTGSQRVAHRLCFEAAELARQLDRPGDLARAALTVGAGTPPWFDHDHLATLGLLREAIDAAAAPETGGGDAAVLAQLRSRLASWGTWTLPRDLRRQLSDDALDAAQQAGQPAALVAVLLDRGLTPPQRLDDVLVSEQAGAALLEQFGDHLDLGARFMAMCWLADGRLLRGDLTGTVLALGELAVLARGRDVVGFSWPVTAIRAMTAVISGDLVTGERLADQAREIGRDLPGTAIAVVHLHQLLVIRGLQGRAGVLVSVMEAMAEQTPEIDRRDVLAWLYAENGQVAAARRLLDDLDPARFTSDRAADPWVHWATNLFGCARACALVGHAELAAAVYPAFAEQGAYAMTATSVVFYGVVDHALANLAAAAGWHARAEQHRRRALAAYQRMPAPLFAAALAAGR